MINQPPFFIGGIGRSGTTLLSMMLDSHRDIKCGPELHFRAPKNLGPYILEAMAHWGKPKKDVPHELQPGWVFIARVERFGVSAESLRQLLESLAARKFGAFAGRCDLVDRIGNIAMLGAGKGRWGMKIMQDIGVLDRYHNSRLWKGARFIHVIKDPRGQVVSLRKVNWGPNSIHDIVNAWVSSIQMSRRAAAYCGAALLEVNFTHLVEDPRATMGKVLRFLGEPWDENVLRHDQMPHTFLESPYGHPSAKQVARPVDVSMAGQWRVALDEGEAEAIMEMAPVALLAKELGFDD